MRQSLFDYCEESNRIDLLAQWNDLKNRPLTPENTTRGSSRKVWWICEKGHQWEATPYSRVSQNTKCPKTDPEAARKLEEKRQRRNAQAKELLAANMSFVDALAQRLLEKETLTQADIRDIRERLG